MPEVPRIRFVDSHTGGEPTRLVLEGGPKLGAGPLAERVARGGEDFVRWSRAVVAEPRGSDPLVGALLVAPHRDDCEFGVIFFNSAGPLGMCGHGTIGLVASLAHLGRIKPGTVRLDTPVGPVAAELRADGEVSVNNVASFRRAHALRLNVPGVGPVTGDVAWGGNWFFLVEAGAELLELARVEHLTALTWQMRLAVNAAGFPEVDHVELFGPPRRADASSRNFVLCPGKAYDRSPCGTGTSAKLACLAADGKLAEGETWVQESLIGSTFAARYQWLDRAKGEVRPTITGTAHVTAEGVLLLDPRDPFCWGVR